MAPKKARARKTTTKKEAKKKKEDGEDGEKKKFRCNSKAGQLTYNNVLFETEEDLKQHHVELRAKVKHDLVLSTCLEKESRLHAHTFIEIVGDNRLDCDLQFLTTSKSGPVGKFIANRGKNIDCGHYYCQCEFKKSYIAMVFDKRVLAKEIWILNWWREGKIERVREALADQNLLTPQNIQRIEVNKNEDEKKKIEKLIAERSERIQLKIKLFCPVDLVVQWQKQYEEELMRYDFLVLEGPSKCRKSYLAMSLWKNYFRHKDKIDWAGYNWLHHDCIIFDDINEPIHIWQYVKKNKVMFQASETVAVNTSATNCYKVDICVVGKPIIICTNDGILDKYCSAEFQEWLKINSVWIKVVKPFALIEDVPALASPACA